MTKITIDFGNDMYTIDAVLKRDGDKWCVMVGDNLQEGIAGFGSEIWKAVSEFKSNFRNS